MRRARRRFSIAAAQMSVRPHIAWYLRWSMVLPFVLAALGLVWFAYVSGLELAGFNRGESAREVTALKEKVAALSEEGAQLGKKVAQYEQQLQMEQGRSQEIVKQLKVLNDENMRLQEDLSFFQNLTAAGGKEGELTIHRLSVEHDRMPGEYRVRMLLVQSGQRVSEFSGSYQIIATIVQDGIKKTQLYPPQQSANAQSSVNFKYYLRLEKSIRLDPNSQLQNIQIRLFQEGVREPRVWKSVNLS